MSMFDAMCDELYNMPFDVIEKIFGDEPKVIADCRKAINEAIHNRLCGVSYPAYHELQDHCSWEDEMSPLDLDEDKDGDWDGGADVDLLSRIGLLGTNRNSADSADNGFTPPDDDLPF